MTVNQKINHPDAVFGPDSDSPPDYHSIAAQIRAVDQRALTPEQHSDVLTMLEYMRDQTVKLYDANVEREQALAKREADVARREREVELKMRTLNSALKTRETAGARLRNYFKG